MDTKVSRRARKKEETKQRIVEAAIQLFGDQGIESTTVGQITEAADVGKGTFYNYFETKEAVVSLYIQEVVSRKTEEVRPLLLAEADTRSRLNLLLQGWAGFVRRHRELVRVQMNETFKRYLKYRVAEADQVGFDQFLAEVLGWGQEAGEIRRDLEARELGGHLQLLIFGPASCYCAICEDYPLEEKTAEALRLFLDGAGSKGEGHSR